MKWAAFIAWVLTAGGGFVLLSIWLARGGIEYRHFPALGGLRRPNPDSINTAIRHASFRAYADHMQTPEFQDGVTELEAFAAGLACEAAEGSAVNRSGPSVSTCPAARTLARCSTFWSSLILPGQWGLVSMTDDAERTRHYRALAAQMRAKAYA